MGGRLLFGGDDLMPARDVTALDKAAHPTCRVCGCSQEDACDIGCYWVEADLCSACEGRPAQLRDALEELAEAAAAVVELQNVSALLRVAYAPYDGDDWETEDALFRVRQATPAVLQRHADAAMRAQRLLDETRWPRLFDYHDDMETR